MAEHLEPLLANGYRVFHDVPAEGVKKDFNLDHVAVGPDGVAVIEIKTRRKGRARPGFKDHVVTYDGKQLIWPWGEDRHGLDQTKAEADWLRKWIGQRTGLDVSLKPILALPDWWVEMKARGDVIVVNSKSVASAVAGKGTAVLTADQIDLIARQLDVLCRDVEADRCAQGLSQSIRSVYVLRLPRITAMPASPDPLDDVIALLERLRARHPLVHCLTNQVVKNFTANVLLALGAAPAMVEHADEAAEFAAMADALLVNLGTLDEPQMTAMLRAIPSANQARKPWVLDPVAVGPLTVRTHFAHEILALRPTLIRGNASEIIALAGQLGRGRGVDSGDAAEAALAAARSLAQQTGGAVLVTGPIDYATDGTKTIACANGHPLMTRVTGVGCAQGAVAAACAAVSTSSLSAAVAAATLMGVAGDLAARVSTRPGSFAAALLDALDQLDADTLRREAKIS